MTYTLWHRFQAWWSTASSSVVFHRRAKWFWTALIPVSYFLKDAVAWVTFMSHYAIITGHWSSEEAAMGAMVDDEDLSVVLKRIEGKLDRLLSEPRADDLAGAGRFLDEVADHPIT